MLHFGYEQTFVKFLNPAKEKLQVLLELPGVPKKRDAQQ